MSVDLNRHDLYRTALLAVCLFWPIAVQASQIFGNVAGAPDGETMSVVFMRTNSVSSFDCSDARQTDLGLPPLRLDGVTDINVLEPVRNSKDHRDRFVAEVGKSGHFQVSLPAKSYIVIVEHRPAGVLFDGGDWRDYQLCQAIPGLIKTGRISKTLNIRLR